MRDPSRTAAESMEAFVHEMQVLDAALGRARISKHLPGKQAAASKKRKRNRRRSKIAKASRRGNR